MKVKLHQPIAGGQPGDTVDLPEAQARGLILEGAGTKVDKGTDTAPTTPPIPLTGTQHDEQDKGEDEDTKTESASANSSSAKSASSNASTKKTSAKS